MKLNGLFPVVWRRSVLLAVAAFLACPVFASGGEAAAPSLTGRMSTLVIQLGLIWFAARLGNMLF